jgi:hypothetical protein
MNGIWRNRLHNQWCESLTTQATLLVFYRRNSASERGTNPDAVGGKLYHWTRR